MSSCGSGPSADITGDSNPFDFFFSLLRLLRNYWGFFFVESQHILSSHGLVMSTGNSI